MFEKTQKYKEWLMLLLAFRLAAPSRRVFNRRLESLREGKGGLISKGSHEVKTVKAGDSAAVLTVQRISYRAYD